MGRKIARSHGRDETVRLAKEARKSRGSFAIAHASMWARTSCRGQTCDVNREYYNEARASLSRDPRFADKRRARLKSGRGGFYFWQAIERPSGNSRSIGYSNTAEGTVKHRTRHPVSFPLRCHARFRRDIRPCGIRRDISGVSRIPVDVCARTEKILKVTLELRPFSPCSSQSWIILREV